MAQSLRKQKIPEKELQRLVNGGIYTIDEAGNYRITKPIKISDNKYRVVVDWKKLRESIHPPSLKDVFPEQIPKQFNGFPDSGTGEYYESSLKPDRTLREFDDDIKY